MTLLFSESHLWKLAAVLTVLLGCVWVWLSAPMNDSSSMASLHGVLQGQSAPHFRADRLLADEELHYGSHGGRPTVINFWASWCPPCRREIPALKDAHVRFGNDLQILGVVQLRDIEPATAMAREFAINYVVAGAVPDDDVFMKYEILSFPTTYFVDRHGVIQMRHIGELNRAILAEGIARILK